MTDIGGIGAERLKTIIERIERLEEEKAALAADVREVFSEAKGEGFCVKTIRQIIKERKLDKADRDEQEAILALYRQALGMLAGTPLGDAAEGSVTMTATGGSISGKGAKGVAVSRGVAA